MPTASRTKEGRPCLQDHQNQRRRRRPGLTWRASPRPVPATVTVPPAPCWCRSPYGRRAAKAAGACAVGKVGVSAGRRPWPNSLTTSMRCRRRPDFPVLRRPQLPRQPCRAPATATRANCAIHRSCATSSTTLTQRGFDALQPPPSATPTNSSKRRWPASKDSPSPTRRSGHRTRTAVHRVERSTSEVVQQ